MRRAVKTPLILEPPMLQDLQAEVAGVIQNSPAHLSGIQTGDIILEVNGESVFSRVEAFKKVLAAANPRLLLSRNNFQFEVTILKSPKEASGLVMDYDLSLDELERIKREISSVKAKIPCFCFPSRSKCFTGRL